MTMGTMINSISLRTFVITVPEMIEDLTPLGEVSRPTEEVDEAVPTDNLPASQVDGAVTKPDNQNPRQVPCQLGVSCRHSNTTGQC